MIRAAALAIVLFGAGPAAAQGLMQSAMPIWPTRDVTVTYKTTGPDAGRSITVDHWSSGNMMRVQGSDQPEGYALIDRGKFRSMVVMTPMRVYFEADNSQGAPNLLPHRDGVYTRAGGDTVAGTKCGLWNIAHDGVVDSACATEDGVLLRYRDHRGGGVEATAIVYQPLAPALFTIPAGFQKFDATMMGGMVPGMPPGGRQGMPQGAMPNMPPGAMPPGMMPPGMMPPNTGGQRPR